MKYKVTLNGRTYEVEVEKGEAILADEYDAAAPAPVQAASQVAAAPVAAAAPAPAAVSTASGQIVESPMPGTILKVSVKVGDQVKSGDVLVILEAMKMENEITAPRDGIVAEVVTSQGAAVETSAPLIVLS